MGYLKSFDYDVFISYGWSGNLLPEEGDRGWVAQFFDHLTERLRTLLGESASIFLDRNVTQAGYLSDRLAAALDSSALLVFVVSPGSCRPDSWCHKEATRFWDHGARPLISATGSAIAPEDRIFKIALSPVAREAEPGILSEATERIFYDSEPGTGGPIVTPADWTQLSKAVERECAALVRDIADQLKALRGAEARPPSPGNHVFLGACSTDLNRGRFRRLRRELLLEGHTVVSATPVPLESESDFLLRSEDAMRKNRIAVFAISDAAPVPRGWRANHIAEQVELAFGLSEVNPDFSVFAWEDPKAVSLDRASQEQIKPNRKDQHIQGKAFEYLQSNVTARLRLAPEPTISGKDGDTKRICIEYREEDGALAAQVSDALRRQHIEVQMAIPTPAKGTLINRIIKKNQLRYYPGADGLVIFFGEGDYEWVSDVCFAMKDFVRPGKGVIVLGPPKDKPSGKEQYLQPGFKSMPCFEAPFDAEFETWIKELRSGDK